VKEHYYAKSTPRALVEWHRRYKRRHPFAGLRLFPKNSEGRRDIAYRHWPTSLTWSWAIRFSRYYPDSNSPKSRIWPISWRGWVPFIYRNPNGGGHWHCGPISCQWQPEMPHKMLSHRAEKDFVSSLRKAAGGEG